MSPFGNRHWLYVTTTEANKYKALFQYTDKLIEFHRKIYLKAINPSYVTFLIYCESCNVLYSV